MDRHGGSKDDVRRARVPFPPVDEERAFDVVDVLRRVASRHEVSVPEVALAWLLAQPAVTSVLCGVSKPEHLVANVKAIDLRLEASDLEELDAVSRLNPSYPGWIQTYRSASRVPEGYPWSKASWNVGERPI